MNRWSLGAFVLAVAGTVLYLLITVPGLPELVATKFHGGTRVSSVMSRNGYLLFMLVLTIGLPLLVLLALGWFPVWFGRKVRYANSEYWFAAERRAQTLRYLRDRGAWIGAAAAAFSAATHAFILQAHGHTPPQAQLWPFGAVIVLFVVATLAISVAIHLHFRRLPRS